MPQTKRPNFVFIMTDQQRRDSLGCYGNCLIKTPSCDALAAQGIVFDRAFPANIICSPSRASVITGRYPRCHGLITNGMYLDPVNEITLPHVLSSHGYRTANVGKIHLTFCEKIEPQRTTNEAGYESPESRSHWLAGKRLPLPYYGFQEVRLCNGHGEDWTDYYYDLLARDPKLPDLFKEENALQPPSGAPSSWKSSLPEEHHSTTWVADESIKMLERYATDNQPFFLTINFPDPHFPYCPPAPWCDMYDPADMPMPKRTMDQLKTASGNFRCKNQSYTNIFGYNPIEMPDPYIREIIAHTYGMVSLLDKHIGRVVAELDRLGLQENTVVIFTTDHGEHLGDHGFVYKAVIYDELLHLPLIWCCPKRFGTPRRETGIVSHIDLMPTILDLASIAAPRGVQGVSYRVGLEGGNFSGRPFAYLEDDSEDNLEHVRTVWTPDRRLTYYLPDAEGDLFDLKNDPDEFVNRWHDPDYGDMRNEMVELLLRAAIEAADPKAERLASV